MLWDSILIRSTFLWIIFTLIDTVHMSMKEMRCHMFLWLYFYAYWVIVYFSRCVDYSYIRLLRLSYKLIFLIYHHHRTMRCSSEQSKDRQVHNGLRSREKIERVDNRIWPHKKFSNHIFRSSMVHQCNLDCPIGSWDAFSV
jgi:hypothetical protein